MDITKIFAQKKNNLMDAQYPTIVFLGDSVTQGCFDCYIKEGGVVETIFEQEYAYHKYVAQILAYLYPKVPVNIINAGISGDNAPHGFERLERDVLSRNPDLTVVCFGLNDCHRGTDGIDIYCNALRNIFIGLKNNGSEVIFMTPNMMNTKVSCHLMEESLINIAEVCMKIQNEGVFDEYIKSAIQVAEECNVRVCDVYSKWKRLSQNNVDITELLSNRINHPTRMMNWMFAYSLVEEMMK